MIDGFFLVASIALWGAGTVVAVDHFGAWVIFPLLALAIATTVVLVRRD
jgi:hypothetical protein